MSRGGSRGEFAGIAGEGWAEFGQKLLGVFILHWAPAFSHSPLLQP